MTKILITGSNRGIGLEFVRQYLADGAELVACCRAPDKATELSQLARDARGKVQILPLDVASDASISALKKSLGDEPLDIVVNNAGVSGPKQQSAEHVDVDGWLETFRVNTIAPILVSQALHANLKRGKDRKLIAITSQLGSTANNGGDRYAYRSSKAALNNAMRGLSHDWARDGILVGIYHPGWVRTDMGGKSAPVSPADSVKGLRIQIARLDANSSGGFFDFNGAELAW
jgi:NAD(P)-dependent dehydrogenase (short-subunit alcohol dehydrogenase family)